MSIQTKTAVSLAATQPRDTTLPAGAGIVLAVVLGSMFWVGLYALLA